jgi:hypothetical protein
MEGITQDDKGFLYVLASQSCNVKGNAPGSRRAFLRAERKGERVSLAARIDLTQLLKSAVRLHADKFRTKFLAQALESGLLDIEGLTFWKGDLYIGLKSPLNDHNAVIISLGNADSLFAGQGSDARSVNVWRQWPLTDSPTGAKSGISGLHYANDGGERPVHIMRFAGLKPEGITLNARNRELCITFDNGSQRPSQMMYIKAE